MLTGPALAACVAAASARYHVPPVAITRTLDMAKGRGGIGVMGIPPAWAGLLSANGFSVARLRGDGCQNIKAGAMIIGLTERSRKASRYGIPAGLMPAATLASLQYRVPLPAIARVIAARRSSSGAGPMAIPAAWLHVLTAYGFSSWLVARSPSEGVIAGTWILAVERLGKASRQVPPVASSAPPGWFLAQARPLADRYHVPLALVTAVAAQESGFRPQSVSPAGASGVMQLMPATAARYHVGDPFDPRQSLRGGVAYLARLMAVFHGNLPLVLAGYNAGSHAVFQSGGHIPPFAETEAYVPAVLGRYRYYRRTLPSAQRDRSPSLGKRAGASPR